MAAQDNFDRVLNCVSHLLFLLTCIRPSDDEAARMSRLVADLVALDPRNSAGESLLHLAASCDNTIKSSNYFDEPQVGNGNRPWSDPPRKETPSRWPVWTVWTIQTRSRWSILVKPLRAHQETGSSLAGRSVLAVVFETQWDLLRLKISLTNTLTQ